MKKVIYIIILLMTGISIFLINSFDNEIVDATERKTDDKFEDISVENVWDDSVLGILTIERIDLKATVKEGTSEEILMNYIGHIEETSTYDGNIGLAGHNRGYKNNYFARINELEIGDTIEYQTKFYNRIYKVENIKVIDETDWSLLQSTKENKITMITCIAGKKEQRLCVQATEMTCNSSQTELQ